MDYNSLSDRELLILIADKTERQQESIEKIVGEIYGNGKKGLKYKVEIMWWVLSLLIAANGLVVYIKGIH